MAHRTQIYLDDAQYLFVKQLAKREKKSIAQVFREWVDKLRTQRAAAKYQQDPIMKLRGIFSSGDPTIAERVDDILYGADE